LKNICKVPGTFWALAIVLAFFTACGTIPKVPESALVERFPLDSGAAVYLFADVSAARSLLGQLQITGFNSADIAQVLDRTRYAVAAFFPPESGRSVQALAWGNYPSFVAGLGFTSKNGWKRQRSKTGHPYWYSANRGLSLAVNTSQAFAAFAAETAGAVARTAADPYAQGPGVEVPAGFTRFREHSCLAFWMEEPAGPLARFMSGLQIPIQIPAEELMAGLEIAAPDPGGAGNLYEIKLRIKTPSAVNARSLVTLLSAARLFLPQPGTAGEGPLDILSLLFARPPEQDGAYLNLRTAPIDERGIALLFQMFSLYSTQN
jgi:hypothetical protein